MLNKRGGLLNILMLTTGGTIGSAVSGGVITPQGETLLQLLNLYYMQYGKADSFTVEKRGNILSEDITDAFYEILLNFFLRENLSAYDGVIVLHGTDTLPYTAALAACALPHVKKPIGFVGSDLPLCAEKSNGVINLRAAVKYIESGGTGVFVPYRNHDGSVLIHSALRLHEADFEVDDFHSLYGETLAELKADEIVLHKMPVCSRLHCEIPVLPDAFRFSKKILLIKAYPSIDYTLYNIKQGNLAAVLHTAYHSGTASNAAVPHSFPVFAEQCLANGIDVYLAGLKSSDTVYASTHAILKSGVRALADIPIPTALALLKLYYNCPGCKSSDAAFL